MMSWIDIANLILTVGLPAAEKLWQLATTATVPTQADWNTVTVLAGQKAKDILTAQLKAAGIALDDPKAVALLALAS